jgi:hypothetical protein
MENARECRQRTIVNRLEFSNRALPNSVMMQQVEWAMLDLEQSIRERAYEIWAQGGHRDGDAEAHWLAAQREILSASLSEIGRVSVGEKSTKSPKPKAKASRKKQRAA